MNLGAKPLMKNAILRYTSCRLTAAVRNNWSVLMELVMSYCFKWQNVLLSLLTPRARSSDNMLRRTLSLCSVEQEWSAQAHWFSFREWLSLHRTIIIAQTRHLNVNIHLNKVLSGILLSCCYQAMTMGLQRSRWWDQCVTPGLFCNKGICLKSETTGGESVGESDAKEAAGGRAVSPITYEYDLHMSSSDMQSHAPLWRHELTGRGQISLFLCTHWFVDFWC